MKFITTLLTLAIASGQTPQTPPKKPGAVEVVVTNSITAEPIKKVVVVLQNGNTQSGYAGLTDLAGHFKFQNVQPGSYLVSATRDGFIFQPGGAFGHNFKPLKVDEEQRIKNFSLKLIPLAAVSGRVVDEDGDPIAGANVHAMQNTYAQGRRLLNPVDLANTNDLGEFQLINLQPGRYYFQASIPSRALNSPVRIRSPRPEETYPATFYPGALDAAQATATEVAPGADITSIDFRLRKMRSYRVRGKIVDAQGQAAASASLRIQMRGAAVNSGRASSMVRPDGSFDVRGLLPGSYVAIAQWMQAGKMNVARQSISISDQDVNGLLLTLAPALEISGSVQVEGPQSDNQHRLTVMLEPLEWMGQSADTMAESDGTFVLHNVIPALFEVDIYPFPGTYLKTIRLGDQEVTDARIDLTQPAGGSLKLVLGVDGGKLDGVVQDLNGDPAAGALITVAPRDELENRRDLFKQSMTGDKGDFHVQDLAPGDYKVFAWQRVDPNLLEVTEFRKPFESKAASVGIVANGHESVQLKIISAADVEKEKSKLP
ncbi:MAG TPA: carboxypeptidase-like regulatory domain-containing protein [Bryobacteraceae bacterium]